ncbi:hypothetical protein GCM10023084_56600 [Streptomyces lacrimifluminis]|uniref:Uncharacterized protein n=1 Tax=Streptomyces lacrimifluminis TaxID=1500077 RepID=A0A917L987_9ACTN|nr:hypothetical protein GCM10012282_58290 [Streptomyces lacrimifluminis]
MPHLLEPPGPAHGIRASPGLIDCCPACCSEFLYWIKAARLRRAARAGGHGPPPLPVSATAAAAPGHSARSTAKADSQARKQLAQPEHQDHDHEQAEPERARPRRPGGRRFETGKRG